MRLDGLDAAAIDQAAALIAAGELVAFPTETVYGLGARADDDAAVAKIFAAEGPAAGHPLIVHVADRAGAERFAAAMPAGRRAPDRRLLARAADGDRRARGRASPRPRPPARRRSACAARRIRSRTRCSPRRPRLGVPGIAAPSANRFGRVSPTTAAHVVDEFGDDAAGARRRRRRGSASSRRSSTARAAAPVLLRPGVADARARSRRPPASRSQAPTPPRRARPARSPPTTRRRAKLRLMSTPMLQTALQGARRGPAEAGGIFPVGALGRRARASCTGACRRGPSRRRTNCFRSCANSTARACI